MQQRSRFGRGPAQILSGARRFCCCGRLAGWHEAYIPRTRAARTQYIRPKRLLPGVPRRPPPRPPLQYDMHNLRALHGKLACQPAHKVYGGSSNQATKQPAEPSILLFEARSQLVLISSKIPSTISTSDVTSSAGGDAAGWHTRFSSG